ncbi:Thioesterase/thiol ester dehydrase-isomerase [Mycena maculata]|uniref:Thioesterase/thiol ester dehydrase-isomerase n=1 Tax=Mycena maculata TaxID=230809 RepID=A0AAD7I7K1_9AGAR|nr:Thioesterase/thiol ester dehydrase-isomerase [Mycena maculata]
MSTSLVLGRAVAGRTNSAPFIRSGNAMPVRTVTSISTTSLPSRRNLSALATVSLITGVSIGAYTLGALYPPALISLLHPRPAPPPPSEPASPESLAYAAALEAELQALPAFKAHRSAKDADEWHETRPYSMIPEALRADKLTPGALRGPGKLALLPLARVRKDASGSVTFVHLGRGLCGHDGIVHGGLLATLLDEALGRNAFLNLPEKIGVTATLSLKYKAPTRADQFVVIRTELVEAKGRKVVVSGRVEDLQGVVLVEADALFIQPQNAKLLNPTVIREQAGVPSAESVLVAEGTAVLK